MDPTAFDPGWEDRLSSVLMCFLVLVGIGWTFMFWLCNYQEPKENKKDREENR